MKNRRYKTKDQIRADRDQLLRHHELRVLPFLNPGDVWLTYPYSILAEHGKIKYALVLLARKWEDFGDSDYTLVRTACWMGFCDPNNPKELEDVYANFLNLSTKRTYWVKDLFLHIKLPLVYIKPVGHLKQWS